MKRAKQPAKSPARVELLVGTWKQYGRGIIEGVWRYAQKHGPWLIDVEPAEADESTAIPSGMEVDGIIATVHTHEFAEKLRGYGVPVINISGARLKGSSFPCVTSDAQAVVRMALEHLRDRGFRQIAFCGEPQRHFIDFWTDAYLAEIVAMGMEPLVYTPSAGLSPEAPRKDRQQDRRRWLGELPKPVGVIGWSTGICRRLAMACAVGGMEIPDEVAIIGLEADDLLGRVVHPPLSGVNVSVERIGYEAARMLDLLLQGRSDEVRDVRIPAVDVVTRQSSDVFAVDDPKLKQALYFIRDHAHEGIDVRDVLRAVPVARRTMERRFREVLGRSPAEEIRRTRVAKVRELLTTTDMPIPDVAEAAGFNYVEHMIPVFKKYHDLTPSKYRQQSRAGA